MNNQFIRKIGLLLLSGDKVVDLSQFHIKFSVKNADVESPNNATIRVYNLKQETLNQIQDKGEFSTVVLNAGYENGNYGVIFQGTICQFYIGRENATDTFLEIRAADGDIFYNQGFVNTTLSADHDFIDKINAISQETAMQVDTSALLADNQHITSLRGSVLFGMARSQLRKIATTLDAGWSIQNGTIVLTDNSGYREGEIVKINSQTGMIGIPEQTNEGIKIKCLLNSRLRIGGLVQINNSDITQLKERNPNSAPVAYNQWALYENSIVTQDGFYRAYVVEHEGDTRGNHWESSLICLAVNLTVNPDKSVDPR